MNRIYKKVFNKVRGVFVAVSEAARSVSNTKKMTTGVLIGVSALTIANPASAFLYPGAESGLVMRDESWDAYDYTGPISAKTENSQYPI